MKADDNISKHSAVEKESLTFEKDKEDRISCPEVFCKKSILKNLSKFARN